MTAPSQVAHTQIVLKVQCRAAGDKPVKMRISKQDAFQKLFDAFRRHAEARAWAHADAAMRFIFDGQRLEADATPSDLDCEDGDVIEVAW
jgi:Ubiquitin-2 like Rad60 SUMO-like